MQGTFRAEFGDDAARNFLIRSLGNLRVRGRFALSERGGADRAGYYVGEAMSQMPPLPGMEIEVRWGSSKVVISDPLEIDKERVKKANRILESRSSSGKSDREATPEKTFNLGPDELVTLAEELRRMLESKCLIVKEGKIPTEAEVKKHEGRVLFDPGGSNSTSTPKYLDEQEAFRRRLMESPQ